MQPRTLGMVTNFIGEKCLEFSFTCNDGSRFFIFLLGVRVHFNRNVLGTVIKNPFPSLQLNCFKKIFADFFENIQQVCEAAPMSKEWEGNAFDHWLHNPSKARQLQVIPPDASPSASVGRVSAGMGTADLRWNPSKRRTYLLANLSCCKSSKTTGSGNNKENCRPPPSSPPPSPRPSFTSPKSAILTNDQALAWQLKGQRFERLLRLTSNYFSSDDSIPRRT